MYAVCRNSIALGLASALALSAPRMGRVARALLGPVIALQVLAISYGAVKDTAYLPFDQTWHHNAFEWAVRNGGVGMWLAVVLAVAIGYLVQRIVTGRGEAASAGS